MKKILFTSVLLTMVAFSIVAQQVKFPSISLFNETTASLFRNEFDRQFTATTEFGKFEQQFFYSGLGNEGKFIAKITLSPNFIFGYYMPGTLPMSFWASIGGTKLEHFQLISKYTTTAGGTTTTNSPNGGIFLKDFNSSFQVLTSIMGGSLTIGGQLFFKKDNRDVDVANAEQNFRKITMSGGITSTEIRKNMDAAAALQGEYPFYYDFLMAVPVAFKTGNMEHGVRAGISGLISDRSGSYSIKNAATNDSNKTSANSGVINIFGEYGGSLPANEANDKWLFGGNIIAGIATQAYSQTTVIAGVTTKTKNTYTPSIRFGAGIYGARLFDFRPAETVAVRLEPRVGISFDTAKTNSAFMFSATHKSTTVNGATVNAPKPVAAASSSDFSMNFSLPMGMTLTPKNWRIGFMFGVSPQIGFNARFQKAEQMLAADAKGQVTTTFTPILNETHSVGLTVPFEGGTTLDIGLTGSLMHINDFRIQIFVPLGTPRK